MASFFSLEKFGLYILLFFLCYPQCRLSVLESGKEFRAKNSSAAKGSLFSKQSESTLDMKNQAGWSESCLGLLETKSQRQKKWARWTAWTQETSYKGKRKVLWDRFRGLAPDELLPPAAPLVASLMGTLRVQEKESKKFIAQRKGTGMF